MKRVYVHGLGQTPADWAAVLAHETDPQESLCPDLPALLRESGPAYPALYDAFAACCRRFAEPIELYGLSLGAVLALQFAAEHPAQVRSLVLIAPQYKSPKGLLRLQNLLFRFMPSFMFRQTGLGKETFMALCRSMEDLDLSGLLPAVSCPVLVVCGEKDRANRKASSDLAEMLPRAALRVIPGAGHTVNTEAPEQLAAVLRAFRASL